ncbi:MAG: PorT family protein [Bacteroidetes bacterium]|nr:MAG: PorT family protein [Bacteroidota bacterium]
MINLLSRKTLFLVLILFLFFRPGNLYSQHILGALSAGINLSQVDGDEVYGFKKVGFNGGPSVIIPFGKEGKWTVTMEILFSMNGSTQKSADTVQPDSNKPASYNGYKLNLNYIQIPLLVHFTDRKIIAGGLGFAYGQLVGVTEWENGHRVDSTTLQGPYTMADFQVLADVRLRIWKRLWADVRYSYSIFPIRTRDFTNYTGTQVWTRKQHNNVISLRLTYIFNDPYVRSREGKTKKN